MCNVHIAAAAQTNAAQDLLPWTGRGISKQDVLNSIKQHTTTMAGQAAGHPGASIIFRSGRAYLSSPVNLTTLYPHQRHNVIVYLQVIQVGADAATHAPAAAAAAAAGAPLGGGRGELSCQRLPCPLRRCSSTGSTYQTRSSSLAPWTSRASRTCTASPGPGRRRRCRSSGELRAAARCQARHGPAPAAASQEAERLAAALATLLAGPHGRTALQHTARPRHSARLPARRYCPTEDSAEISIPIFHFYDKNYTANVLAKSEAWEQQYPWEEKEQVLFGRFSNYHR
jgi:hypothetical protein